WVVLWARPRVGCLRSTTKIKGVLSKRDPPGAATLQLLFDARQPRQHAQILERRSVTFDFSTGGNLFEEPAHDFSRPGFGERFGETNVVRFGDRADFPGHMLA